MLAEEFLLPVPSLIATCQELVKRNLHREILCLLYNILDDVHDGAVAVHHHAHDLVAEGQRVGSADDRLRLVAQLIELHKLQTGSLQTLCNLRTAWVDGDAILRDDDVHGGARRDECCHLVDDARDATAQQRTNDD